MTVDDFRKANFPGVSDEKILWVVRFIFFPLHQQEVGVDVVLELRCLPVGIPLYTLCMVSLFFCTCVFFLDSLHMYASSFFMYGTILYGSKKKDGKSMEKKGWWARL